MITKEKMLSNKKTARIAGALYLLLIILGIYAELFVRLELIIPGDAAATDQNISTSLLLFRIAAASELIIPILWIFLGIAFYRLFKSVNQYLASLSLVFTLVGAAIQFANVSNHMAALLLFSGETYRAVFEASQLPPMALFFLKIHNYVYISAQIFHGLWLLSIGLLVLQSNMMPKILGTLLVIACVSFNIDVLGLFLIPAYTYTASTIVLLPTVIAEFSLCGYLLLKGVKTTSATVNQAI
ncbi:MAG: DUF4386 domain-containing protein [Anaerolineae bacterium]|nr:DUF4386 domain-containing protein [Anaerolineae bacterium]